MGVAVSSGVGLSVGVGLFVGLGLGVGSSVGLGLGVGVMSAYLFANPTTASVASSIVRFPDLLPSAPLTVVAHVYFLEAFFVPFAVSVTTYVPKGTAFLYTYTPSSLVQPVRFLSRVTVSMTFPSLSAIVKVMTPRSPMAAPLIVFLISISPVCSVDVYVFVILASMSRSSDASVTATPLSPDTARV